MCRRKQSKRHSGKYTDLRTAYITSQIHTGDTYKIASSLRVIFSSSCTSFICTSNKLSQVKMLQRRTDCCLHLLCISETFVLSACKKPLIKLFILVGWGRSFLSVAWPTGVQLVFFFCSGVSRLFGAQGSPSSGSLLSL